MGCRGAYMKKCIFLFLTGLLVVGCFVSCVLGPIKVYVTYEFIDKQGNPQTEKDLVLIHKGEVHEYEIWDNTYIPRICPIPGNEKIFTGFKDQDGNLYQIKEIITVDHDLVLTAVYEDAVSIQYAITWIYDEGMTDTWKTDYAVKGSTYTAPDSKSLIGKVYDWEYINFENFQNWICASSKDVKTLQPLETFTVNENVLFIANYSNYCTACYIVLYDHKLPFGITAIGTSHFINEDFVWETGESNHYKVFPELTASENYQWKVLVCDPDTLTWEQKAIMDIDEDFVEAAGGSSAIKPGSNIILFPDGDSTFYLK